MAVIQKIRSRFWLVLLLIGLSLVAFLLMDALGASSGLGGSDTSVGSINGKAIPVQTFEKKVQEITQNYQQQNQGTSITTETNYYLRDQAWQQMIQEEVMNSAVENTGLMLTDEELFDVIQGANPHPAVVQSFTNPETGQFDRESLMNFLKNMTIDETAKANWLPFENNLKKEIIFSKYGFLVKKGLYTPAWMAEQELSESGRNAVVNLVKIPFAKLNDTDFTISDSDISSFYNNNKHLYGRETTRSVDYVTFNVKPSAEDTAKALRYVQDEVAKMQEAKNDSLYISLSSNIPFNNAYLTKEQLISTQSDTIYSAPVGSLIGPYFENGSFKVAKVIDRKAIPDSVHSRHILLPVKTQQDLLTAQVLADSLLNLIKNEGADFAALAKTNSSDGSAAEGGDLGFVTQGKFVKPFNDAIFYYKNVGDVFQVNSQFGIHIIEVLEANKTNTGVKVAYMSNEITPSSATERSIYAKANEFAGMNRTAEAFDAAADENGMNVRDVIGVKKNDFNLGVLGANREIVKWMYGAELNEVSAVFPLDNQFVVAKLKGIADNDASRMESSKDAIKVQAMNKMKADKIIEDNNGQSLSQIASKYDVQVTDSSKVTFSIGFIKGVGNAPKVGGAAFNMNAGDIQLIETVDGVVAIQLVSKDPVNTSVQDASPFKSQMNQRERQRFDQGALEAFKELSEIEDNRATFY